MSHLSFHSEVQRDLREVIKHYTREGGNLLL